MKKIVKLTESDIKRIVRKTLKEDHADSYSDKIGYIISALDNLSPEDLDKVYDMVEDLDPEYDNGHPMDGKMSKHGHPIGRTARDIVGNLFKGKKRYDHGSGYGSDIDY